MNSLLRLALATLALCAIAVAGLADEAKKDQGKTDPAGVPIEARLVANKATYTLDLHGQSPEDFRKAIRAGDATGDYPAAAHVDLVLELKNASDKDLQIKVGGTSTLVMLDLKGQGAMSVQLQRRVTNKLAIVPKTVTLAPGQVQKVPITSLAYGFKGGYHAYWTEPGEYTLAASYKTQFAPATGAEFGNVTITSPPIKIKVVDKK